MDVPLKPQLEEFLEEQVKAGRFSTTTEAVEAGIARLMLDPQPDELDERDLADIRQSLDQMRGGQVLDAEELHSRFRKRFLRQ